MTIYTKLSKNILAIAIYPFVLMNKQYKSKHYKRLLNHEKIHHAQQLELLILPFYIIYLLEWMYKSLLYKSFEKGYYNISFERECYANEKKLQYLTKRKLYSFLKYIRR